MASIQNGGFFEASTPASNGSPKSSLGGATFVETARTIGAPLAHHWRTIGAPLARYRPEYPFPSCVPAELESVFPGTDERTTFQRLLPNHWTQERMPAKIHRPVPRSKDRNRTSPLPLKSKQNPSVCLKFAGEGSCTHRLDAFGVNQTFARYPNSGQRGL